MPRSASLLPSSTTFNIIYAARFQDRCDHLSRKTVARSSYQPLRAATSARPGAQVGTDRRLLRLTRWADRTLRTCRVWVAERLAGIIRRAGSIDSSCQESMVACAALHWRASPSRKQIITATHGMVLRYSRFRSLGMPIPSSMPTKGRPSVQHQHPLPRELTLLCVRSPHTTWPRLCSMGQSHYTATSKNALPAGFPPI